ncbi:hypothetical protein QM787_25365 [Rhodococcus ruber]|uniref:Uncharacterized protein n=1 Tax=Rhodococcus ruber TaxID=1830 RepID=A0A098BP12_9NOCA|nr:hypothetical protein [Rhodococcus ruber]MCD2129860.1 hypothetical protein [Rhodococcus ruber]MCZ4506270.1 hypothetical protein [Rhodococcus ruber]MCZ4533442.1 hypothetical protein [Rhodococcus ruber]MCZ4623707.1 hypothetical protein [Rhodococcus ruber]MDI9985244.1 hypothetical protein [Rhodococcus ruber]
MAPQSEEFWVQVEGIDLTIAAETRRILVEWLGIDPATEQEHIDREALRLQQMTEDAAEQFEQATPDATYRDAVRAKATAWRAAREMVLEGELYPQVTPEIRTAREKFETWGEREAEKGWEAARTAQDPDRWRTQDVKPNPTAVRVVERVWLGKPAWFRALAQALIAQRIEDNQPVPMTSRDPLADELAAMIEDEMRRNPPQDPDLPF